MFLVYRIVVWLEIQLQLRLTSGCFICRGTEVCNTAKTMRNDSSTNEQSELSVNLTIRTKT